ncbi:hypothetical protein K8O68_16765 [Salipaludibacillus sp. CUR1]|uniref:hypothetical protein n=1 Tax=Salipaludibacillus sp. CUR1 TaxID=2820003 RepID=UPI001E51AA48|nr:hypothetical protein [Salipaludibacillus sp. CUR1]MCE7794042.1 hypothetical protein [Salipaludibacillus sp. CUR1]
MGTDRNSIEQAREANFTKLKTYLKENGTRLSRKEFAAVLFAINGMTIYNSRKKDAIGKASDKYGIPKSFIKKFIDSMGIKSKRARQAQKEFAIFHKIGIYKHRKKVEDET